MSRFQFYLKIIGTYTKLGFELVVVRVRFTVVPVIPLLVTGSDTTDRIRTVFVNVFK